MPGHRNSPQRFPVDEWDWPPRRGRRGGQLSLVKEPADRPDDERLRTAWFRTLCLVSFVFLGELAVVFGIATAVDESRTWLLPVPGFLTALALYLTAQHARVAERLGAQRRLVLLAAALLSLVSATGLVHEVRSGGAVPLRPIRVIDYPTPPLPDILQQTAPPTAAHLVATRDAVLTWGANTLMDLRGGGLLALSVPIDNVFPCGASVIVSAAGALAQISVRKRARISRWTYPGLEPARSCAPAAACSSRRTTAPHCSDSAVEHAWKRACELAARTGRGSRPTLSNEVGCVALSWEAPAYDR